VLLLERIFVKLFDDVGWPKAELEDFQNGFLKAVRRTIKIPDYFLWFPVISVRKSIAVRNYCRSTYRFVEKAPRGKVFQLHSALLLNVSNVSSKKTKTFVGDIELCSRPVTCTAKHSGPFLIQKFAILDFWTLENYIKYAGAFFFLSWIRLLPGQNVNENRILGAFGWKVPGEDGTSQKMAWFPIGIFLPEIPVPFFLQDFFNFVTRFSFLRPFFGSRDPDWFL